MSLNYLKNYDVNIKIIEKISLNSQDQLIYQKFLVKIDKEDLLKEMNPI